MLIARDFDASLRFYRDVIGLPGQGESPYAEFATDSCHLVLLDRSFWNKVGGVRESTRRSTPRAGVVLAVQVERVDAEFERIRRLGAKVVVPPGDRPMMGLRNFQVADPDGNLVELTSPLPRPKKP